MADTGDYLARTNLLLVFVTVPAWHFESGVFILLILLLCGCLLPSRQPRDGMVLHSCTPALQLSA